MSLVLNAGVMGKVYIQVIQADGTLKQGKGLNNTFDNLITNTGMDLLGEGTGISDTYCRVGTGSTSPAFTDTALSSQIASTSKRVVDSSYQVASPPYSITTTCTYTFTVGGVVGNISEIGIGSTSTGAISTRALIKDTGGSPTTITLTASDQLVVTYSMVQVLPASATTTGLSFPLTVDGTASTLGYTARIFSASDGYFWATRNSLNTSTSSSVLYSTLILPTGTDISSTTSSNYTQTATTVTAGTYTVGSFSRSYTIVWGSGTTFASGVAGLQVFNRCYFKFDTPIAKSSGQSLSMVFVVSYYRS